MFPHKLFLNLFTTLSILTFIGKLGYAQTISEDIDPSSIWQYFQQMNDTIEGLYSLETYVGLPNPPDFSISEQLLFNLGKEVDHATYAFEQVNGTLDDYNVEQIAIYLHSISQHATTMFQSIKDQKPYSDQHGYSNMTSKVLKGIEAQFSILFQEVIHHIPPTDYTQFGYWMSTFLCGMADTVQYLDPGSQTVKGAEFCSSLTPDQFSKGTGEIPLAEILFVPQCFFDCGSSVLQMLVYGYENGLIGLPQTAPWCPKGIFDYHQIWNFTPSDTQWVVQHSTGLD